VSEADEAAMVTISESIYLIGSDCEVFDGVFPFRRVLIAFKIFSILLMCPEESIFDPQMQSDPSSRVNKSE